VVDEKVKPTNKRAEAQRIFSQCIESPKDRALNQRGSDANSRFLVTKEGVEKAGID
jgi:hypothetical protein